MATLLLRCAGALQSWDTQSNFSFRTTGREPSKSGIIGLVCAALGRDRAESVADLARLRMGVRVDREGRILGDFHTAQHVLIANKPLKTLIAPPTRLKETELSTRFYLNDALFLVGLESEDERQLREIHQALHCSRWKPVLGREACSPSERVFLYDGLQPADLLTALKTYPWLGHSEHEHRRLRPLRLVYDDPQGYKIRNDHPLSFARYKREFMPRRVKTEYVDEPFPRYRAPFSAEEKEVG